MSNSSVNVAAVLNNNNNGSSGVTVQASLTGTTPQNVNSNNYTATKLSAKAREASEKMNQERKRAVLVLVYQYLSDNGYLSAAKEFAKEIGFNQNSVTSADNMDLETILIEFEEYYMMKFGKRPKFIRKIDGSVNSARSYGGELEKDNRNKPYVSQNLLLNKMRQKMAQQQQNQQNSVSGTLTTVPPSGPKDSGSKPSTTTPSLPVLKPGPAKAALPSSSNFDKKKILVKNSSNKNIAPNPPKENGIDVSGKRVLPSQDMDQPQQAQESEDNSSSHVESSDYIDNRILRPLPEEFYFGEMRELAELIRRDILVSNPEVYWEDIAGLADAKQLIKESVVMPLKYPELFCTIPVLSPWNGVLLFGPPGTGKTMLAKAVATECRTTFFNISASSIVSKWRGDSEKLVRILFDLADHYAPSTIFLDELDSIMSQRQSSGSGGGEHEGSRRMKTELLIQMDGLGKRKGQIFVLAASNLPWDLDQAMLRRLEKRILVGLPDETSRCHIIRKLLGHVDYADLNEQDFQSLALETEGYSGADLALVCKESAMGKLRQVMAVIAQYERQGQELLTSPVELLKQDRITIRDVQTALSVTKPSGNSYQKKYEDWKQHYGSNVTL